uniref:Uncharacterized protein n=1 Tax=Rhizophora mucronata TaxID=61149 RepID=A0A2P2R2H2_RHIMU
MMEPVFISQRIFSFTSPRHKFGKIVTINTNAEVFYHTDWESIRSSNQSKGQSQFLTVGQQYFLFLLIINVI